MSPTATWTQLCAPEDAGKAKCPEVTALQETVVLLQCLGEANRESWEADKGSQAAQLISRSSLAFRS